MPQDDLCRKCGSPLTPAGYCPDETCPYSDWPQRVPLDDLYELSPQAIEAKHGIAKAEGPPYCAVCGKNHLKCQDPWHDDATQFARLLAEIAGVGLSKSQMRQLGESMDLEDGDLDELLDRAMLAWEKVKGNVDDTMTLAEFTGEPLGGDR